MVVCLGLVCEAVGGRMGWGGEVDGGLAEVWEGGRWRSVHFCPCIKDLFCIQSRSWCVHPMPCDETTTHVLRRWAYDPVRVDAVS